MVVIALNEASRIANCLASATFADEIVLIDAGSADDTVRIAEQHGAPVLVDEAHSILTCGATGRGMVEESGMESRVRLQ